jgi:hypothetical protein
MPDHQLKTGVAGQTTGVHQARYGGVKDSWRCPVFSRETDASARRP